VALQVLRTAQGKEERIGNNHIALSIGSYTF
jgi:hypothetical protein